MVVLNQVPFKLQMVIHQLLFQLQQQPYLHVVIHPFHSTQAVVEVILGRMVRP